MIVAGYTVPAEVEARLLERAVEAAMDTSPWPSDDNLGTYLYGFVGNKHWNRGGKEEIADFLRAPIKAALSAAFEVLPSNPNSR